MPLRREQASASSRKLPLLTTKLRAPVWRGPLIQRPQLIGTLRQALAGRLALVYGPAGFGKTTLAAQWYAELRQAGACVAWLSLDDSDNDLNRFLAYLVESLRSAEPEIGEGLAGVIEANPGSAADHVIDTLINDLSLLDQPLVLFVDDWHLIADAAIHEVLRRLLSRSPPGFHMVITSRSRAGLPVTRLRVQGELVEIDASRLRFDLEESRAYLTTVKALQLSADDVLALWRSTEGWAAALQLASLSLHGPEPHAAIANWTTGTAADVSEYLAENVMARLSQGQVRFLLYSSVLDRLCGGLCAEVTGDSHSAERLEEAERQELFLMPLDEERRWFRFHHLFQSYLLRRLRSRMPGEIPGLHLRASRWFAANGQIPDAVRHALLAEDLDTAVDLIQRTAMELVERSQMSTLLSLVGQVPRTVLFDRPRVQMAIAWASCLTHRRQVAEEALWHVERSAEQAASERERSLLQVEARVVRACIDVYADRVESLDEGVRACLAQVDECSPFTVAVAANIRAYSYLRAGEFAKVGPLMMWARPWHERSAGIFSSVYGRCFSGLAARAAGQLAEARAIFTSALELASGIGGRQSHAARLCGALLGQILYESNELGPAEHLLGESRLLGFEGGVVDFYLATYLGSSRLKMFQGLPDEALALLEEGEETARTLGLGRLHFAVACERVRVLLDQGDLRSAEEVLGEIDTRAGADALAEDVRCSVVAARARLLRSRGRADAALSVLEPQIERARLAGHRLDELALRVLHALVLDSAGRGEVAEQALAATINDALPLGMIRSFLDEGAPLLTLLERMKDRARRRGSGHSESPEFNPLTQRLLAYARQPESGTPQPPGGSSAVHELTSRESEVLRLLEQGRSNKEIARALAIGPETVKSYLKNIFSKLGVSTRTQAVSASRRRGKGS